MYTLLYDGVIDQKDQQKAILNGKADEFRKHRGNRHNKTREINLSHRRAVGDKRICRLRQAAGKIGP